MKKKGLLSLVLCGIMFACAACTAPETTKAKPWNGILINDGDPITLIVDLNQLMPTTNTEATEQNPIVFRSIVDIVDDFCEMFPNVSIEWAYSKKSSGDWAQWMTTQIATDAPDIVMMHGSEYADRGWLYDLTDILNEPNIFVEEGERGSVHWKDMFPDYMWTDSMTTDAKGNIVAVPVTCYPGTATAYFYNKDIFEELNLSIPTNWEEFKAICDKINQDGRYVAVAPWSLNAKATINTWDIQYSLGPSYAEKIKDQWDYDGNGYMTQDELLRAVYEGVFYGQGENRENILSLYGEARYKHNNILQTGAESTDYEPMWNAGKVAMMEDGMWRVSAENVNAERKFEYGIFPSPLADSQTSEFCADFETGEGAYNPPICESFNICKQAVEQKGEAHLQASKLFLMWLTLPENVDRMVAEKAGECVGAVYGSTIPAELEDFICGTFPRTPACNWTRGVTVSTQTKMNRYFMLWCSGNAKYDDDRFLKDYDAALYSGALDMIEALGIDVSGWKNGYTFG